MEAIHQQFQQAKSVEKVNPSQSIELYKKIISTDSEYNDELAKVKEEAIYRLGDIYVQQSKPNELSELNRLVRPFFKDLPKAKTAKIVRIIIENVGKIPNTLDIQIQVCKESIEWTNREKRTFLRQRIESKLAALYFQKKDYPNSLAIISKLQKEVRRLDDKALLVEINLLESRVQHSLKNVPKAKAALTAGRSAANSIYCPPLLQAEIDMQSGILHAEEKDYKTAYSYFFESFEGFNSLDNTKEATLCLKYMLLCKIMSNQTDDVQSILSNKNSLRYTGQEVESMRSIASAYQKRSLHAFEDALNQFKSQLVEDPIVNTHLSELYENLLEQHLLRIIEPFSRVEISHVAVLINLPRDKVEKKLSQMILDKTLPGILDQGRDCLIVFDEKKEDKLYGGAIQTLSNLNEVVDSLFERANVLFQ